MVDMADLTGKVVSLARSIGLRVVSDTPEHAGYGAVSNAALTDTIDATRLSVARAWIHARKARDAAFEGYDLFADPAWDMLLDLYVRRHERRSTSVTSLQGATPVPTTTSFRWITVLCKAGLVAKKADPDDGRRVYVELSAGAIAIIEGAIDAASMGDQRLGIGRIRALK